MTRNQQKILVQCPAFAIYFLLKKYELIPSNTFKIKGKKVFYNYRCNPRKAAEGITFEIYHKLNSTYQTSFLKKSYKILLDSHKSKRKTNAKNRKSIC